MKLGIVGLPNVGKSTLFNALTNAGAQSANYPFCTIEPNVGIVAVPDARLDTLAKMYNPDALFPRSSSSLILQVLCEEHTTARVLETSSFPIFARSMQCFTLYVALKTAILFT